MDEAPDPPEFFVTDDSAADAESAAATDAQARMPPAAERSQELDGLRIRQLTAIRRAAARQRSYWLVVAGGCAVAAAQLVVMTVEHLRYIGWGRKPAGYVLFILLTLAGCGHSLLRARALTAELKRPVSDGSRCMKCGYDLRGLTELTCPECGTPFAREAPPVAPDFSTLSDGSHYWKNLERMGDKS
jgi:hypothetical protein